MSDEEPHVVAEIQIDATPQEVWDVLMDYDKLPEWSNGFLGTDKPMVEDEVSVAYFANPLRGKPIEFSHKVVVYEEGVRFGWSGEVAAGRHDHHVYEMLPHTDGGTLFRQTDGLFGKPSSVMSRIGEHLIEGNYNSFNKKLKARVEALKA